MKHLLVFTALIATANALNCQYSERATEETCTVKTGKCFSIKREIAIEKDKPGKEIIKGCLNSIVTQGICNQGFILMSTDNDFYLMSNITCCEKDNCNKDISPELNRTRPSSDLVCPSCLALGNNTCDSKSMKCNDLQKKCFNISGTVDKTDSTKAQNFTARGCAVENTLFTKGFTLSSEGTTYKLEDVQFVDAKTEKPKDEKPKDENPTDGAIQISSCLSFAILLPSVLWFLLDSSLY